MGEESKSSIWLLTNLWKPKTLRYANLPLLDVLLPDKEASCGFRWLFSDKQGMVRRKSDGNATIELICVKYLQDLFESISPLQFLSQEKSDIIVAVLIHNDNTSCITKAEFLSYLMKRELDSSRALQLYKPGLCEFSSKLLAELRLTEGKYKWKYYKKYLQDHTEMTISLTAQALCAVLKSYAEEAIRIIERNTRKRIVSGSVVFIEDLQRKVWLAGFIDCKVIEVFRNTEKKSVSQVASIANSRLANYSKTQINISKASNSPNNSINMLERTGSSKGNLLGVTRKKCPGDFCMYLLKNDEKIEKNEIDYDDLLSKVRMAYSGDGNKEVTKMRLGIAVDYLQRERDKLKVHRLEYEIPYKAIVLGRTLLKNQSIDPPPVDTLMELDITSLLNSQTIQEQLEESSMDMTLTASPYLHPSRLYDSVKVCERCYLFYVIIQIVAKKSSLNETYHPTLPSIHKNTNHLKPARLIRPPLRIFSDKLSSETPEISSLTSKSKCPSEFLNTTIGKVNKNNINDLLADMNLALAELETGDSLSLKTRLNKMYKFMTEDYKLRKQIKVKDRTKNRSSISSLSPIKVEHSIEEDIAARFFPSDNSTVWHPKQNEKLNLQNWRKYMRMLKGKKMRKHNRPLN